MGDGADAMSHLASLTLFARTLGYVVPLDLDRVTRLGVPAYVDRSADVNQQLLGVDLGLGVLAPDETLLAEQERAHRSAQRFALLGGSTAVLLLGFVVVAAVGLRRGHRRLLQVLERRGAGTRTTTGVTIVAAALALVPAALVGALAGAAAVAVARTTGGRTRRRRVHRRARRGRVGGRRADRRCARAHRRRAPLARARTRRRLANHRSRRSRPAGGRRAGGEQGRRERRRPGRGVGPARAAAAGARLRRRRAARGARVGARDAGGRPGAPPALGRGTPGTARSRTPPAARRSHGRLPHGGGRGRRLRGLLPRHPRRLCRRPGGVRRPAGRPVAGGPTQLDPLRVLEAHPLEAALPGAVASGVVRGGAVVGRPEQGVSTVAALGVDATTLTRLQRFARVTGSDTDPATLAGRLAAPDPAATAPRLPEGAQTVDIAASGDLDVVRLVLWLVGDDGRELGVPLTRRGDRLEGAIPQPAPAGLRAVGISVREDPDYATRRQHGIGEGSSDRPVTQGAVTLGAVTADGQAVPWSWNGWGSAGASVDGSADQLVATYGLDTGVAVIQPGWVPPAAATPLPVLADPATAATAQNGTLLLGLGALRVPATVVGVLDRFPTAGDRYVVADRAALRAWLDAEQPGTGGAREAWVSAPEMTPDRLAATLAAEPYAALRTDVREMRAEEIRDDPIGSASVRLLLFTAVVGLAVALLAVILLVRGERSDDAAELYALEADGLAPPTLRRVLLVRAASAVLVAAPAGVALGLLLSSLGSDLVALDAAGEAPTPPLLPAVGVGWAVAVVLVAAAVGLAAAAATARRQLREPLPVVPALDLR